MSNTELMGHDPKCHAYGYGPGQRMDICICTGIRIGRADERERSSRPTWSGYLDRHLADLRARVGETLPIMAHAHESGCPGRPGVRGICTCDQIPLVSLDSVLSMIDEVQK